MNEKQLVSSCRDLIVWQKAMTLAVHCYSLTENFPRDERFGILSQMRRSSSSIPADIAEGHGRRSKGAFLNQLSIARGSLMQPETHLILSEKLNFVSGLYLEETLQMTSEISRVISGLMQSLERQ